MDWNAIVNEFVFGGLGNLKQGQSTDSKKKKIVSAVQKDDSGIKRIYFKPIEDYSSPSLRVIFDAHISRDAQAKTDNRQVTNP